MGDGAMRRGGGFLTRGATGDAVPPVTGFA
jgi:hypothetical protein